MRNCPNCDQSIKGFHLDCPHCGYQLVTPEKAQEAIAALEKIENAMLNLDMSPEGISKTAVYIDNVTSFLKTYQELLLKFIEEHKQVGTKKGLFGKKHDSTKAQSYLALMNVLWSNPENSNFSLEVVSSSVPGCFLLKQRLIKIKDLTKTLMTDYSHFFNMKDPHGLEKSKQGIGEISELLNMVWPEIERINAEINRS
jgi:hypothetical protein